MKMKCHLSELLFYSFVVFALLAVVNAQQHENVTYDEDMPDIGGTCHKKHPVVIVNGIMGSVMEGSGGIPRSHPMPHQCSRNFGSMRLWVNGNIIRSSFFECFKEYFQKHWTNGRWTDTPGMSVRVARNGFGDVYPVDTLDPSFTLKYFTHYFHNIIKKLNSYGFATNKDVVAAAYDWRDIPNSRWASQTKELIEDVTRNTREKAVIVCHSMGSIWTYYFLMSQSQAWRNSHIHHVIFVSPAWVGAPNSIISFFAGYDFGLKVNETIMRELARNLPSEWVLMPTGKGISGTLAQTPRKSYSYHQVGDILRDVGVVDWKKKLDLARAPLRKYDNGGYNVHPGVNVTAIMGYGVRTAVGMRFKHELRPNGDNWQVPSQLIMGDGDGTVPLANLKYVCDRWWGQGKSCEAVYITKGEHKGVLDDKKVMDHILANACE